MKHLTFLRHAEYDIFSGTLYQRGEEESTKIALSLAEFYHNKSGIIFSSPMRRAYETAEILKEHLQTYPSGVIETDYLHEKSFRFNKQGMISELKKVSDENDYAIMVMHQPGFYILAKRFFDVPEHFESPGFLEGYTIEVNAQWSKLSTQNLKEANTILTVSPK